MRKNKHNIKSETSQGNSCERARSMLTMQCAEIIQSVDNTKSRKRTAKINNCPPNFKIFQFIHVKCHKASKILDQMYDGRSRSKTKDVCSSLYVSQTLKGTNEIKNMPPNCVGEIFLYVSQTPRSVNVMSISSLYVSRTPKGANVID